MKKFYILSAVLTAVASSPVYAQTLGTQAGNLGRACGEQTYPSVASLITADWQKALDIATSKCESGDTYVTVYLSTGSGNAKVCATGSPSKTTQCTDVRTYPRFDNQCPNDVTTIRAMSTLVATQNSLLNTARSAHTTVIYKGLSASFTSSVITCPSQTPSDDTPEGDSKADTPIF